VTAVKKAKVNVKDISVTKKTDKSSPLTINYGKIENTYTPQKSEVKDSHDR
jgi:type VI protein secretion system component Hcp